eukprot:TRINITY_DN43167_c0_g1_i2.p1 TRINITY_DN43167_c0_g1~~TRINITY_DN43167_c0_g1_i2.p1  ORF type:complete len:1501 (-),score=287.34 TRINITY_DN43167_c0_g1_i2:103-4605(-)
MRMAVDSGHDDAPPHDLLDLADYSYASLLEALRLRHQGREPYTWIGPVLVSVNPCMDLSSFSAAVMAKYLRSKPSTQPHPFAVVNRALKASNCSGPAAVLVTGESGAGKTEAVKAMLSFLVARQGTQSDRVCDVLLGSTQALEAFGNAKTLQNGNSSRFGRLTEVWLNAQTGQAEGACIVPYMLEASRVTHHAAGELSFHIFYTLEEALRSVPPADCRGSSGFWAKPSLADAWYALADLAKSSRFSDSPFLRPTTAEALRTPRGSMAGFAVPPDSLAAGGPPRSARASVASCGSHSGVARCSLEELGASLRAASLQDEQILSAMQVVVAVALLGNVAADALTEEAQRLPAVRCSDAIAEEETNVGHAVSRRNALAAVASLLEVEQDKLREFLVTRMTDAPRGCDRQLVRPRSAREALTLRDSAAREIYTALFVWLVRHIRQGAAVWEDKATAPELATKAFSSSASTCRRMFAVLDIYGFEVCECNGLEQLLINYCNERLQALFNAQLFAAEAKEYEAEGLPRELWVSLCQVQVRDLPALALLEGGQDADASERLASTVTSPRLPRDRTGPQGLFALIDDEAKCRFNEGSDAALRSRMDATLKGRPGYKTCRAAATQFCVAHFAGEVVYESRAFVETNAQAVRQEILAFLYANTASAFLREVVETRMESNEAAACPRESLLQSSSGANGSRVPPLSARGGGSANTCSGSVQVPRRVQQLFGRTVIQAFRSELDRLLWSLQREGTQCHYVRCLKPSAHLDPHSFDCASVMKQCRYSGLLETVQIRQKGFPHRWPFLAFVERYAAVCWPWRLTRRWGLRLPASLHSLPAAEIAAWAQEMAAMACGAFRGQSDGQEVLCGRTRVLMRPRAYAQMEAAVCELERLVIPMQAAVRRGIARMNFLLMRFLAGRIQARFRGRRARRFCRALLGVIKLQARFRGILTRRAVTVLRMIYSAAAVAIQRRFRGHSARRRLTLAKRTPLSPVSLRSSQVVQLATTTADHFLRSSSTKTAAMQLGAPLQATRQRQVLMRPPKVVPPSHLGSSVSSRSTSRDSARVGSKENRPPSADSVQQLRWDGPLKAATSAAEKRFYAQLGSVQAQIAALQRRKAQLRKDVRRGDLGSGVTGGNKASGSSPCQSAASSRRPSPASTPASPRGCRPAMGSTPRTPPVQVSTPSETPAASPLSTRQCVGTPARPRSARGNSGCLACWRGRSCGCNSCFVRQDSGSSSGSRQVTRAPLSARSTMPAVSATKAAPRRKVATRGQELRPMATDPARHDDLLQELLLRCGNISELQERILYATDPTTASGGRGPASSPRGGGLDAPRAAASPRVREGAAIHRRDPPNPQPSGTLQGTPRTTAAAAGGEPSQQRSSAARTASQQSTPRLRSTSPARAAHAAAAGPLHHGGRGADPATSDGGAPLPVDGAARQGRSALQRSGDPQERGRQGSGTPPPARQATQSLRMVRSSTSSAALGSSLRTAAGALRQRSLTRSSSDNGYRAAMYHR